MYKSINSDPTEAIHAKPADVVIKSTTSEIQIRLPQWLNIKHFQKDPSIALDMEEKKKEVIKISQFLHGLLPHPSGGLGYGSDEEGCLSRIAAEFQQ